MPKVPAIRDRFLPPAAMIKKKDLGYFTTFFAIYLNLSFSDTNNVYQKTF
jgi:hypothetical protein